MLDPAYDGTAETGVPTTRPGEGADLGPRLVADPLDEEELLAALGVPGQGAVGEALPIGSSTT